MVIEFHSGDREKEIATLRREKFFFLAFFVQPIVSIRHTGTHIYPVCTDYDLLAGSTGIKVLCGKVFPLGDYARDCAGKKH
jgi:hypothetical protein